MRLTDMEFRRGEETILDLPLLELGAGSQTLLTGRSGSGKSTLLHLLAGFLRPSRGRYLWDEQDLTQLSEREWDRLRADRIGIVFQHYPLLRGFSVLDNLLIPMGLGGKADSARALSLLERVGLEHRASYLPSQLSAGQRQRTALVRSVVNSPRLLLADEPTAHLDPEHAQQAVSLLCKLAREAGSTLIVVSHDIELRARFERHLTLEELQRS